MKTVKLYYILSGAFFLLSGQMSLVNADDGLIGNVTFEKNPLILEVTDVRDVPEIIIHKVNSPISIDGKLSEEAWKNAAKTEKFLLLKSRHKEIEPSQATTTYLAYDEGKLYIGFQCKEAFMDKALARLKERDAPIWGEDSIEVFLDVNHDHHNYYHLISNTLGTMWDSLTKDPSWNGDWSVGVSKEESFWIAEISIPFKTLGLPKAPPNGTLWGINLNRGRYATGKAEWSSWAQTIANFHEPEGFGHIFFEQAPPVKVINLTLQTAFWGENGLKMEIKNISREACLLEVNVQVSSLRGSDSYVQKLNLLDEDKTEIEIPIRLERGLFYTLTIDFLDLSTSRRYNYNRYYFEPPSDLIGLSIEPQNCYIGEKSVLAIIKLMVGEKSLPSLRLKLMLYPEEDSSVREGEIENIKSNEIKAGLNIQNFKTGKYSLKVDLVNEEGRVIDSSMRILTLLPSPFD